MLGFVADNSNGESSEWRKWAHQVLTHLVDSVEQQRRTNEQQRRFNDEFREYVRKNDRRIAALIRMYGRHESDIKSLKKRRS